ncbi:helix-turn-helix domain-containing protein [Mycobacterium sp. LTG2003]
MFAKLGYCLPKFSGIVGRMTTHLDWERLGRFVRAARGPRAQADIAANGGPSDETISKIEQGRWRPTRSVQKTLEKLEIGLGWAPGSANTVLAGGEPTELHTTNQSASQPPPAAHLGRGVMDDFVDTVSRTRESAPIIRASEFLRVVATSVNITRNTLVHDTSSAGRVNAIDTLYAASNAIPYMQDAIEEMKGVHHANTVEAASKSDASTKGHEAQDVAGPIDVAWVSEGLQRDVNDLPDSIPAEIPIYLFAAYSAAMGGVNKSCVDIAAVVRQNLPLRAIFVDSLLAAVRDFVYTTTRLTQAIQDVDIHATREQIDSTLPIFGTTAQFAEAVALFIDGLSSTEQDMRNKLADAQHQLGELASRLNNARAVLMESGRSSEPAPVRALSSKAPHQLSAHPTANRPVNWNDNPPPPPIELVDAASEGYKESDELPAELLDFPTRARQVLADLANLDPVLDFTKEADKLHRALGSKKEPPAKVAYIKALLSLLTRAADRVDEYATQIAVDEGIQSLIIHLLRSGNAALPAEQ